MMPGSIYPAEILEEIVYQTKGLRELHARVSREGRSVRILETMASPILSAENAARQKTVLLPEVSLN